MEGRRQALAARAIASGAPAEAVFSVDQEFYVRRFKIAADDGIFDAADTCRIQAEGELFYSGLAFDIVSVFIQTDDAAVLSVASGSPHVLSFDEPIKWNPDYPITIQISDEACTFVIEAV